MNGDKLQAKLFRGLGIAAKVIGTSFDVYRASTLINPLAPANQIFTVKASFTTGYSYSTYSKPDKPDCTAVIDATSLEAGDWITDGKSTYYLAEKQALVPLPAISCNRAVSIVRPTYTAGSGPMEPTETIIASSLPVFMWSRRNSAHSIPWINQSTESRASTPEFNFQINSRDINAIMQHDVIIDETGTRYEIDLVNFAQFGLDVTARQEKS